MYGLYTLFYSPFFRPDVDYCPNCKKNGKGYTVRLSELQIHTISIPCTNDTSDRLKWTKQRKGLLWKGCDNVMIFLSSPQLPLLLALVPSPSLMLFSHCVTAAWWLTHCRDATSEWYTRWVIHQSLFFRLWKTILAGLSQRLFLPCTVKKTYYLSWARHRHMQSVNQSQQLSAAVEEVHFMGYTVIHMKSVVIWWSYMQKHTRCINSKMSNICIELLVDNSHHCLPFNTTYLCHK